MGGTDDHPVLRGWRREVFGDAALALIEGRLALGSGGQQVALILVEDGIPRPEPVRKRPRRRRKPRAATPAST